MTQHFLPPMRTPLPGDPLSGITMHTGWKVMIPSPMIRDIIRECASEADKWGDVFNRKLEAILPIGSRVAQTIKPKGASQEYFTALVDHPLAPRDRFQPAELTIHPDTQLPYFKPIEDFPVGRAVNGISLPGFATR